MLKKIIFLLPFFTVLVFLPALAGPLLLDDNVHLGPIVQWLANKTDTYNLVFGNLSGPFGRPVSVLSFMLNALTTGSQIWPMKLTNLILHLLTGLCLAGLLNRLFKRDSNLETHARFASIAAASLWLVLPQHIATVFYTIQRMTVLSTLFGVLACWAYVAARERIETRQPNNYPLLFCVPILTLLSVLSKESGVLVPLFFLLIELVYFRPTIENPRPKIIVWTFRLGVFLPCLLVALYLTLTPSFVLHGYMNRAFTIEERAITQISVIADYFASTFFPMMRSAGVYNDDFPIAHSLGMKEMLLLTISTGLVMAAIKLHKHMPSFSFGIGLFFVGHLLESSIFPLEIYFAHRNYFPSIGLVIASFGLIVGLVHHYQAAAAPFKRLLPAAFAALLLAYGAASYSRATLWSDTGSLLTHAQVNHPTSSRLRSEILLATLYGNRLDLALQQADIALQTAPANEKRAIQLWRILAYCYAKSPQPNLELLALHNMPADRITMATSTALDYVSAAAEANACPGLDRRELARMVNQWSVNTVQYPSEAFVWKTHFAAARLSASSGDLETGYKQALWAFNDSGYNFDAGLLAFQLANSLEDAQAAQEVMTRLIDNQASYTDKQKAQIQMLRTQ